MDSLRGALGFADVSFPRCTTAKCMYIYVPMFHADFYKCVNVENQRVRRIPMK